MENNLLKTSKSKLRAGSGDPEGSFSYADIGSVCSRTSCDTLSTPPTLLMKLHSFVCPLLIIQVAWICFIPVRLSQMLRETHCNCMSV